MFFFWATSILDFLHWLNWLNITCILYSCILYYNDTNTRHYHYLAKDFRPSSVFL
jgi:hypothetical protein